MDPLLEESAARILADHQNDPSALWTSLEENGLTRLWMHEVDGGFELAPSEGFGLIRLAGRYATSVPLAETLVATWLLTEAGLRSPIGPMSVIIGRSQRAASFASRVEHVVRVSDRSVALYRASPTSCSRRPDEITEADAPDLMGDLVAEGELRRADALPFAALARAAQISGALEAVLDLTIGFAEQRMQFGRPLSKFQAIQHLLSEMGTETAAAIAATDAAIATVQRGHPLDRMTIAVAKFRASAAIGTVSEHAHQVHGAIGYTHEYALARFTRPLWQWREDFGGERFWANDLGRTALAEPGSLWSRLTERSL